MGHRIVINTRYGGFGLSREASEMLNKLKDDEVVNPDYGYINENLVPRHDKDLIKVVETLGNKANGDYASLVIINLRGNIYRITEYDGLESYYEPDSLDWITIGEEDEN